MFTFATSIDGSAATFPKGESKTILNYAPKVGNTRSEKIDFNRQA